MRIRMALVVVMGAGIIASLCVGQDPPEQTPRPVPQLLANLRSNDPGKRGTAVQKVRSNPTMLRDPNVRSALLDLLDQENHEAEAELRKGEREQAAGRDHTSESSDGNAMYMDDVLGTIESFADLHDPRQVCLLVKAGAVVPESADARENATCAKAAMPCLQQLSRSDLFMDRLNAVKISVHLLASAGESLNPDIAEVMKSVVVLAVHDKRVEVRFETVDWLGRLGKSDMIPALSELAESDPGYGATKDEIAVRKNAAQAIIAIQQREGHQ